MFKKVQLTFLSHFINLAALVDFLTKTLKMGYLLLLNFT